METINKIIEDMEKEIEKSRKWNGTYSMVENLSLFNYLKRLKEVEKNVLQDVECVFCRNTDNVTEIFVNGNLVDICERCAEKVR